MSITSDESRAKILELLLTREFRGQELKDELAFQYGMSNQTYNSARNDLLNQNFIDLIKIKPYGKNYLYRINHSGKRWLKKFRNEKKNIPEKNIIQRRFPFILSAINKKNRQKDGHVNLELSLPKSTSRNLLKDIGFLADSKELNNVITRLVNNTLSIQDRNDSVYHIDTGLKIKIKTDIPKKIFGIIHDLERFGQLEEKWYVERDLLYQIYFKKSYNNDKITEFLASIDFFCSRPEALIECYYTSMGVSDTNSVEDRNYIKKQYGIDSAYYKFLFSNPLSLFLFTRFKWPLIDSKLKKLILKKWSIWRGQIKNRHLYVSVVHPNKLYSEYPRYQPDYKIKVGRKIFDFSQTKFLKENIEEFNDPEVIKWWNETIREHSSKTWFRYGYHLRPWEIFSGLAERATSITSRGTRFDVPLIDTETPDNHDLDRLITVFTLVCKQNPNRRVVDKNDLILFLREFSETSDSKWFNAWPYVLSELENTSTTQNSLLIDPLQQLYEKWFFSKKQKETYHVNQIFTEYFDGLKTKKTEFKLHSKTRNKLRNKLIMLTNNMKF